jgi:hypothetical protein
MSNTNTSNTNLISNSIPTSDEDLKQNSSTNRNYSQTFVPNEKLFKNCLERINLVTQNIDDRLDITQIFQSQFHNWIEKILKVITDVKRNICPTTKPLEIKVCSSFFIQLVVFCAENCVHYKTDFDDIINYIMEINFVKNGDYYNTNYNVKSDIVEYCKKTKKNPNHFPVSKIFNSHNYDLYYENFTNFTSRASKNINNLQEENEKLYQKLKKTESNLDMYYNRTKHYEKELKKSDDYINALKNKLNNTESDYSNLTKLYNQLRKEFEDYKIKTNQQNDTQNSYKRQRTETSGYTHSQMTSSIPTYSVQTNHSNSNNSNNSNNILSRLHQQLQNQPSQIQTQTQTQTQYTSQYNQYNPQEYYQHDYHQQYYQQPTLARDPRIQYPR